MFGKTRSKPSERASSPENLDQLMRVVLPRDWLILVVFGVLAAATLYWSIEGRIPTAVSGRGILIQPWHSQELQILGSGRIESLTIREGDIVHEGDILGRLDQFELRQRIEEDRTILAGLTRQDQAQNGLQEEQLRLQRQETQLQASVAESQKASFQKTLRDAETIAPLLKRRVDGMRQMVKEGLMAEIAPEVAEAEQAYIDNNAKISDVTARLRELDLQLKQSETREAGLQRGTLDATAARRNQIQDVSARIRFNQFQLDRHSAIVSPRSGRITEVVAAAGQIVPTGTRLATIEADDPAQSLVGVVYFPVGDGKKVQPGMPIQVTPDTVERERFGGITGRVVSVSALPVTREGSRALVGNAEVVAGLMPAGPYIEVIARLDRDATASGYRWSSSTGPSIQITPGLTHSARVTVEMRAPITFLLPFLRETTGIY